MKGERMDNLFNKDILTALENFIDKVKAKHNLTGDTKDYAKMLLEELEKIARKENNNYIGVSDDQLENAIVKASGLLAEWKKSKEKPSIDEQYEAIPKTKVEYTKAKKKTETKITNPIRIEKKDTERKENETIEFSLFDL